MRLFWGGELIATLTHLSLVGHFLIIAALYLSLKPRLFKRKLAWGTLLVVTALVHAYLLAMVSLLWLADLTGKVAKRELLAPMALLELATLILITEMTCWQAGYFSVVDGIISVGYGYYRMNLLSIFDPSGWSYILKDIPGGTGDYEGFNFLGLGAILILVFALPVLISGRAGILAVIGRFSFLLLVLLALTLFAVSNKVGLGPYGSEYPLMPEQALKFANIFRSSGRMFWPVFYAIFFTLIFLVVRGYEKRIATVLLGLALVIQVVDTSAAYKGIRKQLMIESKATWGTPLIDPFWEHAASRYTKVRWIQPGNHSPQWQALAAYAGVHDLSTDAVYLARISTSALKSAQRKAAEVILTGRYEPDSLYVLDDRTFRRALFSLNTNSDLWARIDGFNVIAPGWKNALQ